MKFKKMLFFILITALILSLLIIINHSETRIKYKTDLKIEVYSDTYMSDLLEIEDGILQEDIKIDTNTIGKRTITFSYQNKKNQIKKEPIEIEIIDTEKPTVMLYETYTVSVGNTKPLEESIFCIDNYDRSLKREIVGNYDFNTIGSYPLEYIVTDSSNNVTKKNFVLNVVEKRTYTATNTDFQEIIKKHKSEQTMIGIDVSSWQGIVDFEKVKQAGAEFVIIRVGTQRGFEGEILLDTYFKQNIENATASGLPVGIYFFSYALTNEEATKQANWVMEQLKGYKIDLPVVFDWESWGYFHELNLNAYDINSIADSFLEVVEINGYTPMLYGSKNYLENVWYEQENPVWLAHYNETTSYQGNYKLWQICDNGKIDGINGYVDINILYK